MQSRTLSDSLMGHQVVSLPVTNGECVEVGSPYRAGAPWGLCRGQDKPVVVRKELSQTPAGEGGFHDRSRVGRRFAMRLRLSAKQVASLKRKRREAFCAPKGFGTSWERTSLVKTFLAIGNHFENG